MSRAKIVSGAVAEYPYNFGQLRKDNPRVSFPPNPDDATLELYGSFNVVRVPRPAGDVVTEGTPELIGGQWTQTWEIRDYTADENAARLANAKDMKTHELTQKTDRVIRENAIANLPQSDQNKLSQLEGQIASANNVSQVENIDVESGW